MNANIPGRNKFKSLRSQSKASASFIVSRNSQMKKRREKKNGKRNKALM
jgi:hypothetical protein